MKAIMKKIQKGLLVLSIVITLSLVWSDSSAEEFDEISGKLVSNSTPLFYVKEYGAKADGKTYDTQAIQKAIDACSGRGGGIVYFSKGNYLVGTLILKSNVTLYLESEATILASPHLKDYKPPHLIYAEKAKNIAIIGNGVIDGQGASFWDENFRPLERPKEMISLETCRNVSIKAVTIRNTPGWALHLLGCDRVNIDGVSIINPLKGPNTDGIDVVSSSNVFISNCYIKGGDDCICLKARLRDRPCENVTVSDCVLISDDSALKFGTRSRSGIRHCVFTNCVIRNTRYGIALFMKDGGSYEDIHFSNITIETDTVPTRHKHEYPIIVDLEKRTASSKAGRIRNVVFSNISINTRGHCLVGGLPNKPIEDLTFDNVRMRVISCDDVAGLRKPRGVRDLAAPETDYASVPAHLSFANVRGLTLRNFQVKVERASSKRERHAVWGTHLKDVVIDGFKGRQALANGKLATFHLEDCRNVFIRGSQASAGTGTFLRLEGSKTERVSAIGNDLSAAKEAFAIAEDIKKKAFYQSANRLP